MDAALLHATLEKARRLETIAQHVGLTLWQVQELEGIAIKCVALFGATPQSLTPEESRNLIATLEGKSFATIVKQLVAKGNLDQALKDRFENIRQERNWLVHRSRADSRSAVHHEKDMTALRLRLEGISGEALALMKELERLATGYVASFNVPPERIAAEATRTLARWRASKF